MKVPDGLTENEVIEIMYRVTRQVATNYTFGYNDKSDIVQNGIMHCMKALEEEKFRPVEGKSVKQQLTNFLRVHVGYRLSNDMRKKSFRYANPDSKNNKAKYNIMHPLKIHSQGLENSDIFSRENNIIKDIDASHLIAKIREGLSIKMLKDFLKWQNGAKISTLRKKLLFEKIWEILGDGYRPDQE